MEASVSNGAGPAVAKLPSGSVLEHHLRRIRDLVAGRAYQLFEKHGRSFGHDLDDWLEAERELRHLMPIEVRESDDKLTVSIQVPGFKAAELQVRIEASQLLISGKRQTTSESEAEKIVYSEYPGEVFRVIDLPYAVVPEATTVGLADGILRLTLPKVTAKAA